MCVRRSVISTHDLQDGKVATFSLAVVDISNSVLVTSSIGSDREQDQDLSAAQITDLFMTVLNPSA